MPGTDSTSGDAFPFNQEVVWTPSADLVRDANLTRFMNAHGVDDLDALRARAAENVGWFWDAVLTDLDVEFYEDYDEILDPSGGPQRPSWCVGGQMNIVHNLLDKWQGTPTEHKTALRWEGEDGTTETLTYGELHRRVCRFANALREQGIEQGGRPSYRPSSR